MLHLLTIPSLSATPSCAGSLLTEFTKCYSVTNGDEAWSYLMAFEQGECDANGEPLDNFLDVILTDNSHARDGTATIFVSGCKMIRS